MSDNELNEVKKVKRPAIVNSKYTMSKKELKALRSEHQEQIAELKAQIAELKQAGMTAMPVCYQSKLNESEFQITMIDALL